MGTAKTAATAAGAVVGGVAVALGVGIFKAISNLRKAKKVKTMQLNINAQKFAIEDDKIQIAKDKSDLTKIDNPEKLKKEKEKISIDTEKFHKQSEIKREQISQAEEELSDKIGTSKYLGKIHQKYKADGEQAIINLKLSNADILGLTPDKIKELKLKHKELSEASAGLEASLKEETDKLKSETKDMDDAKSRKIEPLIKQVQQIDVNIAKVGKSIEDAGGDVDSEEKDAADKEKAEKEKSKEKNDDSDDEKKGGFLSKLRKSESLTEDAKEKLADLEKDLYRLLHKRQVILTKIQEILGKTDNVTDSKSKEKEYLDKLKEAGGTPDTDTSSKNDDSDNKDKDPETTKKIEKPEDDKESEGEKLLATGWTKAVPPTKELDNWDSKEIDGVSYWKKKGAKSGDEDSSSKKKALDDEIARIEKKQEGALKALDSAPANKKDEIEANFDALDKKLEELKKKRNEIKESDSLDALLAEAQALSIEFDKCIESINIIEVIPAEKNLANIRKLLATSEALKKLYQ